MLPNKPGRKCKHNYLWSSIRNKHLHSSGDAYCGQAVLGGGTKRWNWKLPNQVNGGTELFSCAVWGGEEVCLLLLPSFSFHAWTFYFYFLNKPTVHLHQGHHPPYPRAEPRYLRIMTKVSTISLGYLCLLFQFIYKMLPEEIPKAMTISASPNAFLSSFCNSWSKRLIWGQPPTPNPQPPTPNPHPGRFYSSLNLSHHLSVGLLLSK